MYTASGSMKSTERNGIMINFLAGVAVGFGMFVVAETIDIIRQLNEDKKNEK